MMRFRAYGFLCAVILSVGACTSDKATVHYNAPHAAPPSTGNPNDVVIAKVKNPSGCFPKEYPREARRNEETGTSVLVFLIDVDGKVLNAKIGKSSGWPDLDNAAMAAFLAPACQFYPILVNGQPAKSWGRLAFTWSLQ